MRASLRPLMPLESWDASARAAGAPSRKARPAPFRADVAALQSDLNARGAKLVVDGKMGPATKAAVEEFGEPAPVEVPPLDAWIGRNWASEATALADKTAHLGLGRVSLFLTPLEARGRFEAFGGEKQIIHALDAFKKVGVGVDFTVWIWPRLSYLSGMQAAISDVLDEYRDVRLCLDCEGPWGRKATDLERMQVREALVDWLGPARLAVTDYASIQAPTRVLCVPGVTVMPQLYSVAYTREGDTGESSVYWPGRTQPYGMHPQRWGGHAGECPLEIGLAAYKPFAKAPKGFESPEEWQIVTQVRAALWFRPRRLVFWELVRMTAQHEAVIRRLSGVAANVGA